MIGFNALGRLGRLANQMFQYASLKCIARNNGYEITIPNHQNLVNDGAGNMLRTELFDSFKLDGIKIGTINAQTLSERMFNFDDELFNTCPDNVDLIGFFQSEKYFKNIEREIRSDFTFDKEISVPCEEMISNLNSPVALHVRRTDYLTNPNHNSLSLNYYESALQQFASDREVVVFSDDPNWCKEQEIFSNDRFLISENEDNRVDLCLMSLCNDFIIANSSFSWWGAWLSSNEDKIVTCPSRWFGPDNVDKNLSDLFPSSWRVIDEG